MGCKDALLPETLLKNHTLNCLKFEDNTIQPYHDNWCLFRALALQLPGNQWVEEKTPENFNSFIKRIDGISFKQFKGDHMNDIPIVEDLLTLNILLYDIDIVDWNNIRELAWRSVQNTKILSKFWDWIIVYVIWAALMQSFNIFVVLIVTGFSKKQSNWNEIQLHAVDEWKLSIRTTYIKLKKLFDKLDSFRIEYTNEQKLLKSYLCSTLNQFVCKKKASKTPIQKNGLESIFTSRFPFPQLLWMNQPSFATLIIITSLVLSSLLLKS